MLSILITGLTGLLQDSDSAVPSAALFLHLY